LLAPTTVYRTYDTDLYGGSSDDLYVTWIDKDGKSQAHTQYGSGTGVWMSFSTCAEEGTFYSTGSIIEGDIKTFDDGALRSLHAVKEMVKSDGAKVFNSLEGIAMYLNQLYK
jgi:hypothetical protein